MSELLHPIYSMSKEEVLFRLLKKEHGYYKAIHDLAKQEQEKLALNPSLAEFKAALKKKKVLLACISEIETALTPLKKHWQDKKDRNDFISKQVVEELDSLNVLLREIMQMDLNSQKTLENHFLKTQSKSEKESKI